MTHDSSGDMNEQARDHHEALWRDFPKTAEEFNTRFPDEAAARDYLIRCRWNGVPACAKCGSTHVWPERGGTLFECADCRHQTSITSGTLMHGTRKPLRTWFRAIFEVCVRRNGISAADLQRILGFGSYETAWAWLHKIRRALVREKRYKLDGCAQVDEAKIGGKGADKEMIVVAAEQNGRVRMVHVPGNHAEALKVVADAEISEKTEIKTDGHKGYNKTSLGGRSHHAKVQSKAEKQVCDHLQLCHWAISNLKRWLLGTHHGGVRPKHLQSYLDEFAFRYNRRHTCGPARLVARCLEGIVARPPMTLRQLIDNTEECRIFQRASY